MTDRRDDTESEIDAKELARLQTKLQSFLKSIILHNSN